MLLVLVHILSVTEQGGVYTLRWPGQWRAIWAIALFLELLVRLAKPWNCVHHFVLNYYSALYCFTTFNWCWSMLSTHIAKTPHDIIGNSKKKSHLISSILVCENSYSVHDCLLHLGISYGGYACCTKIPTTQNYVYKIAFSRCMAYVTECYWGS